ncbi:uncharacterized protein LOC126897405 [Daktulosphaira vitifoliae]|uniref:uncharacterized protein LOC126897405 n=1 Tax=Daktulosphaira vitifoliae TaxID=58002 RepID=UPI0021A98723|nr:uncharacterized protein LOC126897405 [Daktulosphaira vitifoliae]
MMFKKSLMILLALSFAFSMDIDDRCIRCPAGKSAIVYPCMHKACNDCIISDDSICPICLKSTIKTWDLDAYREELKSLKAIFMDKSITFEKIISHYYFLPPWQNADEQMLTDIQKIKNSYPFEEIYELFNILQNGGFNYTIEEDLNLRRRFFCVEPNNREKIILQSYYNRNHYDAEKELKLREKFFDNLGLEPEKLTVNDC